VDNLTHSLFGLTLARAGLGRRLPHATATLIVASNIPDIDIAAGLRDGVDYLAAHRGPTHGPLGVVGLGLLTAALISGWRRIGRRWARSPVDDRGTRQFVGIWVLAMIGIASHVLMDLPTSYGTRLLSPFVWTWYALDWMPIIDVYLWLVLIGALVAGSRLGQQRAALIALGLMAFDYSARAMLHQRALTAGAFFNADGVHAPCITAPTLIAHSGGTLARGTESDMCLEAAALPTFLSPFTWRIIREHSNGYELSDRHVFGQATTIASTWLPSDSGPEVDRVGATRPGRVYLDFARFPLAELVDRSAVLTTVQLFDARFVMMPLNTRRLPASARLSVTVTIDASGRLVEQRFAP
jgi:membrane-bound metal-dependent hydrolase YbcI (DUF457 family)